MSGGNIVYSSSDFIIFRVGKNSFVVYNKALEFKQGHTHVNNYAYAKNLVHVAKHRKIPHNKSIRFYESLLRILPNSKYKITIAELKEEKLNAKK